MSRPMLAAQFFQLAHLETTQMKRKSLRPLNPIFADTSMSELITKLEQACLFESHDLEAELTARLERSGRQWRFTAPGTIELYYPSKARPTQRDCNIGLFNRDDRSQLDVMDAIWQSKGR